MHFVADVASMHGVRSLSGSLNLEYFEEKSKAYRDENVMHNTLPASILPMSAIYTPLVAAKDM